jgi:hypothetical protein
MSSTLNKLNSSYFLTEFLKIFKRLEKKLEGLAAVKGFIAANGLMAPGRI